MLYWSRKHLRATATVLVAVFAGLLLSGTCAAAASSSCESPCTKSSMSADLTMPCAQAVTACDLPSLDAPIASALDFSVTPVVLAILPFDPIPAEVTRARPMDWQALRPPSTPIYITHLALLI